MEFFLGLVGLGFFILVIVTISYAFQVPSLQRRIRSLEKAVKQMQTTAVSDSTKVPQSVQVPPTQPTILTSSAPTTQLKEMAPVKIEEKATPTPSKVHPPIAQQSSSRTTDKNPLDNLRQWIIGENPLVRIGLLLLFMGVAFLLRQLAQHGLFPMEVRLSATALLGCVLLILGWRFRISRPAWALPIQGGASGILLFTIFAAFRLASVIPQLVALPMSIAVVALTAMLGVLQNSQILVLFALVSGFAAPLVLSTGSGNYIGLFSYYAILNMAILAIAVFRNWRVLNMSGFLFTYVIGTTWGILQYKTENFFYCELFLILFYAIYSTTAVLFARKEYKGRIGYVDGSLVFVLPMLTFALQSGLVDNDMVWLAWTAALLGAHYLITTFFLLKSKAPGQRDMAESMLVMGISFASLAVPLALSGQWTTATWAIEGVGLLWLSFRQNRMTTRVLGILLILASNLALWINASEMSHGISTGLSVLVAISHLIGAWILYQHRELFKPAVIIERIYLVLAWLVPLIFAVNWMDEYWGNRQLFSMINLALCLWSSIFWLISRVIPWKSPQYFIVIAMPFMSVILLWLHSESTQSTIENLGWLGFGIPALIWGTLLWFSRQKNYLHDPWNRLASSGFYYWVLYFIALIATDQVLYDSYSKTLVHGAVAWLGLFGLSLKRQFQPWMDCKIESSALWFSSVLFIIASLWITPDVRIPWLPLINAVDVLVVAHLWLNVRLRHLWTMPTWLSSKWIWSIIGAFAISWLTVTLLRAFDVYGDVPFGSMHWNHRGVQMALSLLWATTALAMMIPAARFKLRALWKAGAILLGIEVLKLFFVDLSSSGSTERVISFVGVGLLIVAIGFFAPLPTHSAQNLEEKKES